MNINRFLGISSSRKFLNDPFLYKNMVIATNGHVLLMNRAHSFETIPDLSLDQDRIKSMDKIISIINDSQFESFNFDFFPEDKDCGTCKGTGCAIRYECQECEGDGSVYFSNDYNTYGCECGSCDGEGDLIKPHKDNTCPDCLGSALEYKSNEYVEIHGHYYNPNYIWLIRNEPNLKISVHNDGILSFKAGLSLGAIMPIKTEQ